MADDRIDLDSGSDSGALMLQIELDAKGIASCVRRNDGQICDTDADCPSGKTCHAATFNYGYCR